MATLHFLGARYRSLKDDGTVNASGTVEFFEPGTSTPKTTYSDSALSSANDDIITLDAAGAADIWFSGNADVTIKDSAGVTIETFSNINLSTNSLDTTGNHNLIINPSFEGSVDGNNVPEGWDLFTYAGATPVKDTDDPTHGDAGYKITTADPSAGGGYLTSKDFFSVDATDSYDMIWSVKASAATITVKIHVLWYDKDDSIVLTQGPWSEQSATPTSWERIITKITPPATAVKAKLRLFFASTETSTVGSAQYDNIVFKPIEHNYYATATGTDTYAVAFNPKVNGVLEGDEYKVKFTNSNTSTTPTIAVDDLGAIAIKKGDQKDLIAGDISANHQAILRYDGTFYILLNPSLASTTAVDVRQTILSSADTPISDGGSLDLDLAATATDLNVSFAKGYNAEGPLDSVLNITADVTSAWTVTDEAINYLYIQDDGGTASYNEVVNLPPVYGPTYLKAEGAGRMYSTFEGTHTATAFTDANGDAWTFVGTAQLSNAQTKFNATTSLLLDGNSDRVESPTIVHAGKEGEGFQIKVWFWTQAVTASRELIVGGATTSHFQIAVNADETITMGLGNGSTWNLFAPANTTTAVAAQTWHRARLVYDGTTYKLYLSVDGAAETEEQTYTGGAFTPDPTGIHIGQNADSTWFGGHIEEFSYEVGPQTLGTETPDASERGGLPSEGEHWFDTTEMKMKENSGGTWTDRNRVFVGEAVAASAAISSVVNYATRGEYDSGPFTVANNTTYNKSDNLGDINKNAEVWYREDPTYIWERLPTSSGSLGAATGIADRNTTRVRTAITYINGTESDTLGSASGVTETAGEYKLKVRRAW